MGSGPATLAARHFLVLAILHLLAQLRQSGEIPLKAKSVPIPLAIPRRKVADKLPVKPLR